MDGRDSTQSLLVLRKLTRAIADVVRTQMTEHLADAGAAAAAEDGARRPRRGRLEGLDSRRSEKAFKELQALYERSPRPSRSTCRAS